MSSSGVRLIDHTTGAEVARYPVADDERVSEAVLSAFGSVGERGDGAVLYDFVDPDALDRLFAGNGSPTVSVELWGHPVVITPDMVTVYEED